MPFPRDHKYTAEEFLKLTPESNSERHLQRKAHYLRKRLIVKTLPLLHAGDITKEG